MKRITEENIQNLAYQTLMEVYIEEPSKEQYDLLSALFEEWCKTSNRRSRLHHMFEIIESHESQEVRELVLENMKKNYPDNEKDEILELWITHPLPIMEDFVKDVIENGKLETPIKSAGYVMLDNYEALNKIDPDFHHLDVYLRDVDPLLGSLLIQKVEQLKNPELDGKLFESSDDEEEELSITDRIRKRDFAYIWENILDYPIPFIVELMRITNEEEWRPVDESDQELYEILEEQFGTKGWYAIDHTKWVVVSKKVGGKFVPLSKVDVDRRSFELQLNQDLIVRPDRITNQNFKSRGRFNLSNAQLGMNIYMETVRISDFDGLIHVPIYSSNGVELAEFTIPASSEKNFVMDDEGMYFTVKNKEGIFSVDLDALAIFLIPISRHSEMIYDMIPILLERASQGQRLAIEGINLLSTLHRGREFSLWDLKKSKPWDDNTRDFLNEKGCKCTIAIDLGNGSTKVSQVIMGDCEHEIKTWEFPSIIYYNSTSDFIIGDKVIEKGLEATSQTFNNIKASLKYGSRRLLRIQNSTISSFDAYKDFLFTVIEQVQEELDFEITSVAMTFPVHAPSGFESWLRGLFLQRGYSRIELIDELSATVLGSYRLYNQRGNVMVIDIGSSQISAAIAEMSGNKSRKRLEEARMGEIFDYKPEMVTKLSIDRGSLEISELMYEAMDDEVSFNELLPKLNQAKLELSKEFETTLVTKSRSWEFSMDGTSDVNFKQVFENSELFSAFKILLRNVMAKAHYRGIPKKKIDHVLILGKGSQWPPFLDYINSIFKDQEILIEDDNFLTSKGVGLLANGQEIDMKLDQDVLLKVAKNGIVGYETVLQRGESPLGKSKEFEIRPHTWMNTIVLDCWVRRPIFVPDSEINPVKDGESVGHNRNTRELFTYDRVFRDIIKLEGDALLRVNASARGTLYFEIESEEDTKLISTNSSLY